MISFIIVSYKDRGWLIKNIESIRKNAGKIAYEVIIIDNAMDAELRKEINELFEGAVYYSLGENKGYGAAVNFGVSRASGEYICIANADTEIIEGDVERICKRLNEGGVGLIGPKIVLPNGKVQITWGPKPTVVGEFLIKLRNLLYGLGLIDRIIFKHSENEFYAEWLTGAFFFMRRDVYQGVKGFDEKFFLYSEDTDLCMRLLDKGYKILFSPYVKVLHHVGISKKNITGRAELEAKRSQLYFYKKHCSKMEFHMLRVYLIVKFYFKLIYYRLRKRKDIDSIKLIRQIINEVKLSK